LNADQPLVSIIIPCYNSRPTLVKALASLICQTYPNWEGILIDDGSTDGSGDLVRAIGDPRFRVIRFEQNRGRPVARQRGHEEARGEFVAMLDADDWWYSTKLEKQVRFLKEHPEVQLVSAGMAIADDQDECVGYRCCQLIPGGTLQGLVSPPIAWAPVCLRVRVAKSYSFNPRYRRTQDLDFLQRVCLKERFANLPEALYVYREYQNYNWKEVSLFMRYRIHALSLFWPQFPYQSTREIAKILAKFTIYALAFMVGQHPYLVTRRSSRSTSEIIATYLKERASVQAMAEKIAPRNC
jgi:glycosyltransferase involved in cell wall biosynthesis